MSWLWVTGSLFYWFRYEKKYSNPDHPPELPSYPRVALIAPFFNEERVFRTIRRQSILGIYVILATLYVPPYRQQSSGRFVPLIFASFAYEIGLIVTLLKISVDYTAH